MRLFWLILSTSFSTGFCRLLDPVDTSAPEFEHHEHPLSRPEGLLSEGPIETNKFYTNFLIEGQNYPAWTHPYTVWWSSVNSGMAVSQTKSTKRQIGRNDQFLFAPSRGETINLNAAEFSGKLPREGIGMKLEHADHLSVHSILHDEEDESANIRFPLALGMGFVTAIYQNLTPVIKVRKGIIHIKKDLSDPQGKYLMQLGDGSMWVMYVSIPDDHPPVSFELQSDGKSLKCSQEVNDVMIQLAGLPDDEPGDGLLGEAAFDEAAGSFITGATLDLEQTFDGDATYRIDYEISGNNRAGFPEALIFALPHQVESFTDDMAATLTELQLDSTVFGKMTGVISSHLEMYEPLDEVQSIGFSPWGDDDQLVQFDKDIVDLIVQSSLEDLENEPKIIAETNGGSNYFSFKALDKYALLAYSLKYGSQDDELAERALQVVKDRFQVFKENAQTNPFVYDSTWGGVVSISGMATDADPHADFGNSYYNDHHFHYGYLIHSAAIIGHLDPSWIDDNHDFVNIFIRDVANPSHEDPHFPVWRSFDWFTGKSWAKGLFAALDGKDEESSSEDYHFAYAMKLWGHVTGDNDMETRGNVMLALMNRALHNYILYSDDNANVPEEIARNKVCGILFDNKIEYYTYFGGNPEFIHGIHMLPITPISPYMRHPSFVEQEWNERVEQIYESLEPTSTWTSILKLNQAIFDPADSLAHFASPSFDPASLDGGLSRAWALTFAAALLHNS
ncbi:hypothetical protein TRICI_000673 [Trichomonascus ciferrii]|uniref:glucan endo-1,3-beta-D-glucosidase n=1 Tax=Trichomonascus ciferrii TaxID=44093 RepID=A0A642VAM6_9ASCO|nr:hypothetical protein TRICI_000673 [Trichomonascus ciferrii]